MQRLYSSRASRIAARGALSVWQRARGYRYFSSGETLGLLQREEGIYLKARRGNPPVLQYATGQTCRLIERPSGKPWGYAAIVGQEASGIRTLENLNANTIDSGIPRIALAAPRTVWSISSQPLKEAHIAPFPPRLAERMILSGCPRDGIVCDPFMGSGTVALVARQHRRDFIGCDINPDYVDLAYRRLARES